MTWRSRPAPAEPAARVRAADATAATSVEGAGQLRVGRAPRSRRPSSCRRRPDGRRDRRWRRSTATSGAIPRARSGVRSGVSHSTVPTRRAEPSESSNSPRTVPVPKVVSPMIGARPASWSAPDTISDELAVSPSTRTTRGRSVATPSGETACVRLLAVGVALDVDDAALQELAGDADRLVDVAARVAAEVEDQALGAGRPGRLEGVADVVGGAVRELVEAEQGGLRARHHGPGHGLDGHVGADDRRRSRSGPVPPAGRRA